jgi:hypothetical protein
MKQLFIIIALAFTMNAGAQTTAVTLQHGKYINKQWKYNKPLVTSIPVVFDYPHVSVGDSTYKLTDNVGDTTTSTYNLYVSHCVNNNNAVGLLSISIYNDGSYYLSVAYGNLIRRYTLKYNGYEMGNN